MASSAISIANFGEGPPNSTHQVGHNAAIVRTRQSLDFASGLVCPWPKTPPGLWPTRPLKGQLAFSPFPATVLSEFLLIVLLDLAHQSEQALTHRPKFSQVCP